MPNRREYPERPVLGVGGVVISTDGTAGAARTSTVKASGRSQAECWSWGKLYRGSGTRAAEETGVEVRVVELIEVFERISLDAAGHAQYHFVVLDYFCEAVEGEARAGSDALEVAWASGAELEQYSLTPSATRWFAKRLRWPGSGKVAASEELTGGGFGQSSEAALAAAEIFHGGGQIGSLEFGPHLRSEK